MKSGVAAIFMGSDAIALPLLEEIRSSFSSDVNLAGVFTQPDRRSGRGMKLRPNAIKRWAEAYCIPVRQPDVIGEAEIRWLQQLKCELIIVMAYGQILLRSVLDLPTLGAINFHASLLPAYRGASPIQASIANSDVKTGVSAMRMIRRLDAGPVVDMEEVPIGVDDTAEIVAANIAAACCPLVDRVLPKILAKSAAGEPQDERKSTFTRILHRNDGELDFSAPALILHDRIRALQPWPGACFTVNDTRCRIGASAFDMSSRDTELAPGKVFESGSDGLTVATGRGLLRLLRLQRPGGRMLKAADFLRGFPISPGSVLEGGQMRPLTATKASDF